MKGLHVCLFLLLLVPSIPHPLAKLLGPADHLGSRRTAGYRYWAGSQP